MLEVNIPGKRDIKVKNIVFDYNGTLAVDGEIKEVTKSMIKKT